MVEGGTLLRCYTSQRGIEGSNPSSSAPEAPRLQEQRGSKAKGRERSRPLLHQRTHQCSQNSLLRGRKHRMRNRVFVFAATRSRGCPHDASGSAQPRRVSLSRFMHDSVSEVRRTTLPRTPVNWEPGVDHLACSLFSLWAPDPRANSERPLGSRWRVGALTLTKRRLSRSLYLSFGALQHVLQGVANLLEPPPERLVYRVAHL